MRHLLFSISCLLFFGIPLRAQNAFADIDSTVKEIKSRLAILEKAPVPKNPQEEKKKYTFENQKTLITVNTTEGGVNKKVAWFFDKKEHIYCEQYWTDSSSGSLINQHQFYFRNKRVAKWIDNGVVVDNNSEEFKSLPDELYNYGIFLLNE